MRGFLVTLTLLLACLPLAAQDAEAQKKFAGTWEAKFKDKVVCTLKFKAGEQMSGETGGCHINVDANGDLKEPDSDAANDGPQPILNARIEGTTLRFEEKDGEDILKFELTLAAEREADLKILDVPFLIKPIHFTRK